MSYLHSLLLIGLLSASSILYAGDSVAQANQNRALNDRLERLENELMTLQRDRARGTNTNLVHDGMDADRNQAVMGSVDGDVYQQLNTLQEELRNLRGDLEKNQFETRKNAETLTRLQKDVDFRLNALETQASAAAAIPEPVAITPSEEVKKPVVQHVEDEASDVIDTTTEAVPSKASTAQKPADANAGETSDAPTTAGDGQLKIKPTSADAPREAYNQAFRLLNQTKYEEASSAFEAFTKKYPSDPLIGNAYYWLGETHYIQRDYVKAADNFREGFERLPSGPKAPDNLLKLAMTLRALNRNDEACTVLGQIKVKFKDSSTSLLDKTDQERSRIGCK